MDSLETSVNEQKIWGSSKTAETEGEDPPRLGIKPVRRLSTKGPSHPSAAKEAPLEISWTLRWSVFEQCGNASAVALNTRHETSVASQFAD